MRSLSDRLGLFTRFVFLVLLILVAVAIMATNPEASAALGFDCSTATDRPEFNRFLCSLDPRPLLQTPVSAYLPFLAEG